jgi:hypothetical protein
MPYIYKVATININGISSDTRIRMLEEFHGNKTLTLHYYKK